MVLLSRVPQPTQQGLSSFSSRPTLERDILILIHPSMCLGREEQHRPHTHSPREPDIDLKLRTEPDTVGRQRNPGPCWQEHAYIPVFTGRRV